MLGGHGLQRPSAFCRRAYELSASIIRTRATGHKTIALEAVDDAGDVAAGDHEPARQLAHRQVTGTI